MSAKLKIDKSLIVIQTLLGALYLINNLFALKTIAKSIILFIVIECLRYSQHGHYEMIRSAYFLLFLGIALIDYTLSNYIDIIIAIAGAIFYIPFYKPHFDKATWHQVNAWVIAIILTWILIDVARYFYERSKD